MGFGHENVQATHSTTLEFTKDRSLSKRGNCILLVSIDKGLTDLGAAFRDALRKPKAKLTIRIEASGLSEEIHAYGSHELTLTHPAEMVLRKSNYSSDRTLGIRSDKAACDVSRELAQSLKNPKQLAKITLTVQA